MGQPDYRLTGVVQVSRRGRKEESSMWHRDSWVQDSPWIEKGISSGGTMSEIMRDISDRPLTKSDFEHAYKIANLPWDLVDVFKHKESGNIVAVVLKDGRYHMIPASVEGGDYE